MSFDTLGLSAPILEAITKMGFTTPTPVQEQVIPRLLANKGDLVALAQTGTGKTAAFGLPILNMLDHKKRIPQALVLCPTRELCVQIERDMKAYASCSPAVSTVAVYGGAAIQPQLQAIKRGAQVIVATPGRMLDIIRRGAIDFSAIERVILDEADEMLNMGFKEDLEAILEKVPDTAHKLLFSATMPRIVATIAKHYMKSPEEITIGQRNAGADTVSHDCYIVHERDRYAALKRIADFYPDTYAIVFCRTRQDTQRIADQLIRDDYNADALHGDLTQAQRDSVMAKFRSKHLQLLVATDVAARGLDVNDLTHVINYALPDDLGGYTHRSGRTGRAGKKGVSVLLINMREKSKAHRVETMIGKTFRYREVPSGRDICEAQLLSMIARMKNVDVDHKQIEPFLANIFESLKGMSWEEVVKRFVSLEFNSLLKYYRHAVDLTPQTTMPAKDRERSPRGNDREHSPRGSDRERSPRGNDRERGPRAGEREHSPRGNDREHSPREGERVSRQNSVRMFINVGRADGFSPETLMGLINREGGRDVKIGRIEVLKKHSIFDVREQDAETLMLTVGMAEYKGRMLHIEPAGDTAESPPREKHGSAAPTSMPRTRHGKPHPEFTGPRAGVGHKGPGPRTDGYKGSGGPGPKAPRTDGYKGSGGGPKGPRAGGYKGSGGPGPKGARPAGGQNRFAPRRTGKNGPPK